MTESKKRITEGACIGCLYLEHVIFKSRLPEGGVHDDAYRRELVVEIEELTAREEMIREMRQLREAMVRVFFIRHSSESNRQ